jgi:tetratricopeptide (TPR) repeat protein
VLLEYYPIGTQIPAQSIPPNMSKSQKILELIIKNKYFTNSQLLYAKLKYLLNDKSFAMGIVQNIFQIDPKNIDAATLSALICIDNSDFPRAKELINEAMITNLSQTREHPYFMIAKAKCEVGLNETENAQKTLNDLLKNFDKFEKEGQNLSRNSIFVIKAKDRLDLLKLNIEILLQSGKTEEAQQHINKLISEMQDSNMEDDILMLNSELALKGGDLKKAVNLLKVKSVKIFIF